MKLVCIPLLSTLFLICVLGGTLPSIPHSLLLSTAHNKQIVPLGSPLGNEPYIITAGYHDPHYFQLFHHEHTGVDLIPKISAQKTILYAPMDGTGYYYHEVCSGDAVIILNTDYLVYLGHIAEFLFQANTHISFHQPVAIMGESGEKGLCVTGMHVHYQIEQRIHNQFVIIDPTPYL